ncbi:pantoate--beta-alanine ligase [bacterium]|nr:pantoate--beta-alanine ligase [bacterium]
MKIIQSVSEMQSFANSLKKQGKTIAFVPTMGYLHEGHLSLVEIAQKNADFVVVSIFVNPTQFGPNEDFEKYPRNFEGDVALLEQTKAILFVPENTEIYLLEHLTFVEVNSLENLLCGKSRKSHFKGVTTIIAKLFNIVKPDFAVFGQKDAQQVLIIKKMVEDLNFDVKIIVGKIIREKDGLAMSSRNKYLNEQERKDASVLFESLKIAKKMVEKGEKNPALVIEKMEKLIQTKLTAKIDYVEIVNTKNLQQVKILEGEFLIALAVKIGQTRLIDNLLVGEN